MTDYIVGVRWIRNEIRETSMCQIVCNIQQWRSGFSRRPPQGRLESHTWTHTDEADKNSLSRQVKCHSDRNVGTKKATVSQAVVAVKVWVGIEIAASQSKEHENKTIVLPVVKGSLPRGVGRNSESGCREKGHWSYTKCRNNRISN